MGYYIETPGYKGKAKYLHDHHDAQLVLTPETFNFQGEDALICVVDNGIFEAAGVAYDADERDHFNLPDDDRPKVWLSLPKIIVLQLCPYIEREWQKAKQK